MIFGLRYVKGSYLQSQLVTAVAAAESLHAAMNFPPPLTDEEFKARRRRLMDCTPREEREWLRQKLGTNSQILRQRLLDLTHIPYAEIMDDMLPNPEAWAKAAKDERNAIAHGGKDLTRDVSLLNAIVTTTTAVVLLNLLHQLQVPADRIKIALRQNQTLKSAKYLAGKHWPTKPTV